MGIERDYLMRQMKMLFDVLQKILAHRLKGEEKQALEQIKYFYNYLKLDEAVLSKTIEELTRFLVTDKKLTHEHIEMIAFVIKEQGELAVENEKKLDFFRKSYFLLDVVDRESTVFSMDRKMKLAELREYIN